jgi:hypothetical protein
MMLPQVMNGDSLQIWMVAVNVLNKQSWTSSKGWLWELGMVLTSSHHKKNNFITGCYKGSPTRTADENIWSLGGGGMNR